MKYSLLRLLCCPECAGELELEVGREEAGEVETGELRCGSCGRGYPITRFVPRFVPPSNYAENFGLQWNRFARTQLDSHSGVPISRERFFSFSGWDPAEMSGALVLDVGCGAGRFAEVSLGTGAEVVAVDYSVAVDACWNNLRDSPRLHVVQADLYALPFRPERFDLVYCLGVLQHTPDVARAFSVLPTQLRSGGRLTIDVYPRMRKNLLWPKYWLRRLTPRIPPAKLFRVVEAAVPALLPVSVALGRVPVVGRRLRHAIPVVNYDGILPLSPEQQLEWSILDTFDMLSPVHDHPQSIDTVRRWFAEAGMVEVEVFRRGFIVGRGRKPPQPAETPPR